MKYWAVVPAAGIGQRMGMNIPKQYLPLAGRTVIDWSVGRLSQHPLVQGVVVALGKDDPYWQSTEYATDRAVTRVDGGVERCHSVLNALQALTGMASSDDWVLVHDAARPCVLEQDITNLIDSVQQGEWIGGLLGMPVRDTMKRTDVQQQVLKTVERKQLWHAFTPQLFRLDQLRTALGNALKAGVQITDEASAMEWAGFQPLMVECGTDNIKITRPADLQLAEFYLQSNH